MLLAKKNHRAKNRHQNCVWQKIISYLKLSLFLLRREPVVPESWPCPSHEPGTLGWWCNDDGHETFDFELKADIAALKHHE